MSLYQEKLRENWSNIGGEDVIGAWLEDFLMSGLGIPGSDCLDTDADENNI
jgi:hypothetical protein